MLFLILLLNNLYFTLGKTCLVDFCLNLEFLLYQSVGFQFKTNYCTAEKKESLCVKTDQSK